MEKQNQKWCYSGFGNFKAEYQRKTIQNFEFLTYGSNNIPHVVVDTDAGSEIDDQFALAYLLKWMQKGAVKVDAFYAAPFREGLPRDPSVCEPLSFAEIKRVCQKAFESGVTDALNVPVFHGSNRYLWQNENGEDAHRDCNYENGPWTQKGFRPTPVDSEAARHLVSHAKQFSKEQPLWVIAIGAFTNVASALLLDPSIGEKIRILYLGGNLDDSDSLNEFNVAQDPLAYAILESAPAFRRFPCTGVTETLGITIKELTERLLKIGGPVCEYLAEINEKRLELRRKHEPNPVITVMWDIAPVAYLLHPEWFSLADDGCTVIALRSDAVLKDMFDSL